MDFYVRPSVISGTWYPDDRDELQRTIEGYFAKVNDVSIQGEVVGLISPHAGYLYSGQVAAHGYKLIVGKVFDIVVIISPLHQMAAGRYVVNSASYYETPLGRVSVDRELVERITADVELSVVPRDNEHSLEIQLPFLQIALGDFKLLPIMVGPVSIYNCVDLVKVLVNVLGEKKILLVASTDLHHIANYDEVVKKDRMVVETLSGFDINKIREVLSRNDCSVCGRVPVSIVVDTAQRLGADKLVVLSQTNSGDVTGEKSPGQYTVGYLSAAIVKS